MSEETVTAPVTPGQAAGVDPSSTAYRVHARAFNTLTTMIAHQGGYVPLSVREAAASAIIEAIEPLVRANEVGKISEQRDGLTERIAELVTEGNDLRALVAEIFTVAFDPEAHAATMAKVTEWRARAGLEAHHA